MNRLTGFIISFILLVLVYAFFFFYTYYVDNTLLEVSNMNQEDAYVVQRISRKDNNYTIEAYYPVTKYEVLNNYINRKIYSYIEEYESTLKYNKNETNDNNSIHMNFEFERHEKYDCYIFRTNINDGNVHPYNNIFTVNFDTEEKKIMDIAGLCEIYDNYLFRVSNYCFEKLNKMQNIKKYSAESLLELGTKATKENYSNFILSPNKITILFEQSKVAPYVLGEFKVDVPLSAYLSNN